MTYEEATPGVYRPFIAGSADGFALLGLKSWDLRGPLISYSSCEAARNTGPWDTLVHNADHDKNGG